MLFITPRNWVGHQKNTKPTSGATIKWRTRLIGVIVSLERKRAWHEKKSILYGTLEKTENPLENNHVNVNGGIIELANLVDNNAYIRSGQSDILKGAHDAVICRWII